MMDVKSLEEFYYLVNGTQYKSGAGLITGHQCIIGGMESPALGEFEFETSSKLGPRVTRS